MNYLKFLFTLIFTIFSFEAYAYNSNDLNLNEDVKVENAENVAETETAEESKVTVESYIEENELDSIPGFLNLLINKENDDHFLVINKERHSSPYSALVAGTCARLGKL